MLLLFSDCCAIQYNEGMLQTCYGLALPCRIKEYLWHNNQAFSRRMPELCIKIESVGYISTQTSGSGHEAGLACIRLVF